jgi:membrane-associated protease RseP (regulator of RpoE activity)
MEQNKRLYVVVAAVGLLAVLLSSCLGALAGGTVGYWAGRQASKKVAQGYLDLFEDWGPELNQPVEPQPSAPERWPSAPDAGALITEVVDGSPAERAGIQAGDWIIAVDGVAVDEQNSLGQLIGQYEPGDSVRITLWRSNAERTIRVRLGEHPEDSQVAYLGVYYQAPSMRVVPPGTD